MATEAWIQGSYRVTADATLRFTRTDTADTVDWVITEGQQWDSADELLADWTTTVQADGNFGSAFTLWAFRGNNKCALQVDTGGPSWVITWWQAGDGSDLRDWLGGSGATDSGSDGSVLSNIPASFVAHYAAIQAHRSQTTRNRGQMLFLDGGVQGQHDSDVDEGDRISLDVELRWGDGVSTGYAHHFQIPVCIDAIFDSAGGGEPFSVFSLPEDHATPDQWVVRFADDRVELRPRHVHGSKPGTLWSLRFPSLLVESAP